MINLPLLLAFVGTASILVVTPGVDTAIVLRAATAGGRWPAAAAAVGIALGCLLWGGAVSLGLGALLRASETAYAIVKLVGAAYLVSIGIKLLLKPRTALSAGAGPQTDRSAPADMFWRGFLSNLLNPKVGVFYVTFLPQFVPAGTSVAAYSFFLACLHVALTLIWFGILISAMVPLSKFLRRPSAMRKLDKMTGGIFIAFGIKLAASSSH
ncbi:LysE family translocator [Burkholderia diffusa]|uniref:LysE family translocator n=1 Tax=Burkholderia diffusa TaxID=488732 RepID=UPI0008413B32|nr:LysE family translocator [Burkholderia diffusa]AOI60662.1 lysine transporter LysE [Burkholderia diffusa]